MLRWKVFITRRFMPELVVWPTAANPTQAVEAAMSALLANWTLDELGLKGARIVVRSAELPLKVA